jgi:hypothetical protein
VRLVDNLNARRPRSAELSARRGRQRPRTPGNPSHAQAHGSWLNIAEIELSALSGQCLSRHLGPQHHA